MRKIIILMCVVMVCMPIGTGTLLPFCRARERPCACSAYPAGPAAMLARAVNETCSICKDNKIRIAIRELNAAYAPGKIIRIPKTCGLSAVNRDEPELLLVPDPDCPIADKQKAVDVSTELLPTVGYRFHTASRHLVGIAKKDFTLQQVAEQAFGAGGIGCELEIVAFAYGDGASFLYNRHAHHIQVHCRILRIW
ncbi:MAG: hypothetical protein PVH87_22425 [Desulfobacteraceae bacterium]